MPLKVENKNIVVPGEIIAEGMDFLPGEGAFRESDLVISKRVGLLNVDGRAIKIIPLAGTYLPKVGDRIICKVFDLTYTGWRVDTNTAYSAMLSMKEATSEYIEQGADLSKYYAIGDYMVAKIIKVTGQNLIDISLKGPGLMKLRAGRIVNINPCKVPRIIGKQGSMVSKIKTATGCNIVVGQNGLIWVRGEPEAEKVAVECIQKIDKEAHISGLTEAIDEFLKEKTKNLTIVPQKEEEPEQPQRERRRPERRGSSRGPPRRGPPRGPRRGGNRRYQRR
ncbi:RNA-binding protein [Candidatus Woesearchaeota archaeon]|nr:RNA-binding protein [Candidatus Woesearchaeota archaeon]